MLNSGLRAVVLAAYSSRNRVMRDKGGRVHVSWGPVTVKVDQRQFLEIVELLQEACEQPLWRGELARGSGVRVVKCAMGQVMLVHESFTLWFSPEQFEDFCKLAVRALHRLQDSEPVPALGIPCSDCACEISEN